MRHDISMVQCVVIFYLFGQFFSIYLCHFELLEVLLFKQENILLLIELKQTWLHYNKVTSLCH